MERYIVGDNIVGYTTLDLNEDHEELKDGSILVVILKEEKVNLHRYYREIKKDIIDGHKVILVSSADDEKFRVLATMMASLGRYDIYLVTDSEVMTAGYLETVEERHPDYIEVQNYIGGDVVAYDKITEMLMTIENLIDDADEVTLKNFIEENRTSLDSMTVALDRMKKDADLTNSKELVEIVDKLNEKIKKAEEDMVDIKEKEKEAIAEKNKISEDIKVAVAEKEALMNKVEALEEQLQSGTPVISYYNEVNLAYTQHSIQRVLYFKELSYVPHVMSLINSIHAFLTKARKLNVKFVIYDSSTELYEPYVANNIKIINGKNYTVNKPMLTGKNSCLIAEPNPVITNDLLTVDGGFDVLIIYDRMHRYENILTGSNVTRILVTSSARELEAVRKKLNITVSDMILTVKGSSIYNNKELTNKENIVDIEEIPDYSKGTESAKVSGYAKIRCSSGERLFDKIFKTSHIDALYK